MTVGGFLAVVEPFFTFEARLPPTELRRLSLRQVRAHLLWWEANRGSIEITNASDRG